MSTSIIVLIVGLLLLVGGQENAPCFNLDEEDCAALQEASANTVENLNSFTHNFSLAFALTGLEALGMGGDVSIAVNGNGSFAKTPDSEFPFALSADIEAVFSSGTDTMTQSLNFVVVDDTLYVQNPENDEWQGVSIVEFIEDQAGPGVTLDSLMSGEAMEGMDMTAAVEMLGIDPESISEMGSIPGFINHQRLEDDDGLSPYSLTLDFETLFAASEFQTMIESVLAMAGESDPMMQMAVPAFLNNTQATANLTQWIGDEFLHGLAFALSGEVDINTIMTTMGSEPGTELDPVAFNLAVSVEFDELNSAPEITVPEGASIVPVDEFMGR